MKIIFYSGLILILLSVSACQQLLPFDSLIEFSDVSKKPKTQTPLSWDETGVEVFTVNLTEKTPSVKTRQNTSISLPNSGFINSKYQTVGGTIQIVVRECRKPSDMLLNDKPTLSSNGDFLESFGEFHVSAFQNGAPLQLQDGAALTLVTDMTNKSNTLKKIPLWEADTTIIHNVEGLNEEAKHVKMPQAFPVSRGASWQLNGEKANVSETQKVEFSIKRLDTWVNCDALIPFEQGGLTTLLVYVNQNHIPSVNDEVLYLEQTAEVYFKPDGLNSLIKLYNPILTRLADKRGFYSYENSMPVGMSGQLLAFIRYKEHFFVDLKRITISVPPVGKNFSHVTVQPIEVSKATFLDMVKRLDD